VVQYVHGIAASDEAEDDPPQAHGGDAQGVMLDDVMMTSSHVIVHLEEVQQERTSLVVYRDGVLSFRYDERSGQ
jgi:hypothetical protein